MYAKNSIIAYQRDWNDFESYCKENGFNPLPASPETLSSYINNLSLKCKYSTITRRIFSIGKKHRDSNYYPPNTHPIAKETIKMIKERIGTEKNRKNPLLNDDLKLILQCLPEGLKGIRDRCLLLIGFCGGLRRSEIVALNMDDIEVTENGLMVTIRHSKTDQTGEGQSIGIPYGSNPGTCPVRSYQAWIEASKITEGAIFRAMNRHGSIINDRLSDRAVSALIKGYARITGLDLSKYSGSSLRAGMATQAAMNGENIFLIQKQGRWKCMAGMEMYFRNLKKANKLQLMD